MPKAPNLDRIVTETIKRVSEDPTATLKAMLDPLNTNEEFKKAITRMLSVVVLTDPTLLLFSPKQLIHMLNPFIIFSFELGRRYGQAELVNETLEQIGK